jgi:hypothetical protein
MNDQDYALVVGIDYYPGLGSLAGAQYDADQFAAWLADPDGGGLPVANIRRIRSGDFHPPAPASPFEAKPDDVSFEAQLLDLVLDHASHAPRQPAGRRLYLYFSGHGFSGTSTSEAALYAANAAFPQYRHIAATRYAEWLQAGALYQEIVLIMDCCRDMSLISPILSLALAPVQNPAGAAQVRRLGWYAVPAGAKARERQIDPGGPVRGVFTYLLLEALAKAPADNDGEVWADRVADHVQTRWPSLAPNQAPPVLPVDMRRNLVLARRAAAPLSQVTVHVAAPDGTPVVVSCYADGQPKEVLRSPVQQGRAVCALAPGYYKFSLEGSGHAILAEVIGSTVDAQL